MNSDSKNWAMAGHLSAFVVFVGIPFPALGPLVVWLLKRGEDPYAEWHAKEALNFNISIMLYTIASAVLILALVGIILLPVVIISWFVLAIVGGVRVFERRVLPLSDDHTFRELSLDPSSLPLNASALRTAGVPEGGAAPLSNRFDSITAVRSPVCRHHSSHQSSTSRQPSKAPDFDSNRSAPNTTNGTTKRGCPASSTSGRRPGLKHGIGRNR